MRSVVLVPGDMPDIFWISRSLKVPSCTWDDVNTFVLWNGNDPARWSGKVQQLGGKFAGLPVPVARGGDRLEVFGLVADHALYQKSYNARADAMGNHWSPARENRPPEPFQPYRCVRCLRGPIVVLPTRCGTTGSTTRLARLGTIGSSESRDP